PACWRAPPDRPSGRGGIRDVSRVERRAGPSGWPSTGGSPWPRSCARHPDGDRSGRRAKAESARPWRGGGRPNSVHVKHSAEMGAAHEEPGRPSSGSLSARHFCRRFPGGAGGLAGQGRAQPFAGGDRAGKASGKKNIGAGKSAICRRAAMSMSGRMASICRRAWSRKPSMLVLMGATPEGKKELIGFQTGLRESTQSWKELLVDLKARGLSIAPEVATGDGALGFWKALDEAFPTTRHQ